MNEQDMVFKISIIDKTGTVPIAKNCIYVDGQDVSHFVHAIRDSKLRCIYDYTSTPAMLVGKLSRKDEPLNSIPTVTRWSYPNNPMSNFNITQQPQFLQPAFPISHALQHQLHIHAPRQQSGQNGLTNNHVSYSNAEQEIRGQDGSGESGVHL